MCGSRSDLVGEFNQWHSSHHHSKSSSPLKPDLAMLHLLTYRLSEREPRRSVIGRGASPESGAEGEGLISVRPGSDESRGGSAHSEGMKGKRKAPTPPGGNI